MLDRLFNFDVIKIDPTSMVHGEYSTVLALKIFATFDGIWEEGCGQMSIDELKVMEQITGKSLVNDLLREIYLTESSYFELLGSDWYIAKRLVIFHRLMTLLKNNYLIDHSKIEKLTLIFVLATVLNGIPTYLDGDEIGNWALFSSIKNLNNHVISNPNIQSYHQFQNFVTRAVAMLDSKCVGSDKLVKRCDEFGIIVSAIIIHAMILIFNRHPELRDKFDFKLTDSLKLII